jgi:hypothetical protein
MSEEQTPKEPTILGCLMVTTLVFLIIFGGIFIATTPFVLLAKFLVWSWF